MAKIDITRTELLWPGKYNEHGTLKEVPRVSLPFQVIETVNESRATRDVRFFDLAYLEAKIKQPNLPAASRGSAAQAGKLTAQVALSDFVIPNTELIPEDVRGKVKKWSDYIDYWAVDWDFQSDTFMQGWVAYRTRKERKLPLVSDAHAYLPAPSGARQAGEKAGRYRILVKVIDIFGNDTSQAFDLEVK